MLYELRSAYANYYQNQNSQQTNKSVKRLVEHPKFPYLTSYDCMMLK